MVPCGSLGHRLWRSAISAILRMSTGWQDDEERISSTMNRTPSANSGNSKSRSAVAAFPCERITPILKHWRSRSKRSSLQLPKRFFRRTNSPIRSRKKLWNMPPLREDAPPSTLVAPEYFKRLDAYGEKTGERTGLVVLGELGVGKSALLANWVEHYRKGD